MAITKNTCIASALLLSACSPPTAPTPAPAPPVQAVAVTHEPTPAPEPTPTPDPLPPHVPPAPRGFTFDAEVGVEYWNGPVVFPGHFELTINPTRVEAGSHGFDILSAAPDYVYVVSGARNVETLTIEYYGQSDGSGNWTWTYNGLAGHASGGLVRR